MQIDILTIFPPLFDSFLDETLVKKAQEKKLITVTVHDIRSFATDKHHQVDDRPFGGGPGMVLMIEPLYAALNSLNVLTRTDSTKTILLSPTGNQFTQPMAQEFATLDRLVFVAGRYEGVDARIDAFIDERISVGPYIVSGGEVPTMLIIEALSRHIPGVLGNQESLKQESRDNDIVLNNEYPVYSRPEVFVTEDGTELSVPPVLLSGDHAAIAAWRKQHSKPTAL